MEIRLANNILEDTIGLLYELSLKGKQSRHRTKFVQLLGEEHKHLLENEKQLLLENCYLDDEGQPKTKENGKYYDVKDVQNYTKERVELHKEEVVIGGANLQVTLKTVKEALRDCDEEFSKEKAVLYGHLCEVFKVDEEIEDGEDMD